MNKTTRMKAQNLLFSIMVIIGLGICQSGLAQVSHEFGFKIKDDIVVQDSTGTPYDMPWIGGINSMHFATIDLNQDGTMDLIGFEIHGNKLYPFVNNGTTGQDDYSHAPEYVNNFPHIVNWIKTVDYNNDGKKDLFTHGITGIMVYKNISTPSTGLVFQQVTNPVIFADFGGSAPINIPVSSVDYPGFVDLDYDGDIDIVAFPVLGTYVYYYKNLSMELYGNADHLKYKLTSQSWGNFSESESTNTVFLNNPYKAGSVPQVPAPKSGEKHTGSTMLMMDYNNDSLYDMLLGDVDYFNLNMLTNGGTIDSAHITSQDTAFPSYDEPIDLISFPASHYIDVDNDGTKELIISSFEASYYKPQGINSVHLYENTGTNAQPVFDLVKKNFMQEKMIDIGDNASPAITDVDGDGLLDIVVGNYGRVHSTYLDTMWYLLYINRYSTLSYFKNIGSSTNPAFKFEIDNWLNIDSLQISGAQPTFGDIDGDGDQDMLIGQEDGSLIYFENTAGPNQMMTFAAPVRNYASIDIGKNSSPQLFDLDKDNILDLVIGRKDGQISYFNNTGTSQAPVFTKVTDTLGYIDVRSHYHKSSPFSAPRFYKDENDTLKLFVGSASGFTFFFDDIENNLTGTFGIDTAIKAHERQINYTLDTVYSILQYENAGAIQEVSVEGLRTIPAIADLNNDGRPDMVLGTFRGGLRYFEGTAWPGVGINDKEQNLSAHIRLYPNPANDQVQINFTDIIGNVKNIEIQLCDITGRVVDQTDYIVQDQISLHTSNLENGVYFVNIYLSNSQGGVYKTTKKVIIHH
jgi:hypothetical protein